jgi:hypothetical protein
MFSEGDCRKSGMRRFATAGRNDSAPPVLAFLILPLTLARSRRDLVSQRIPQHRVREFKSLANWRLFVVAEIATDSKLTKRLSDRTGSDGRVNSPRQYSISRGLAPIPPFYPRRGGCRLRSCAVTPEDQGADGAVRRSSVHARALHVVVLPPRDKLGTSSLTL